MIKSLPLILTLGMMWSVVSEDFFLGTEIDDKLAGTLALGKSVVVTDWNGVFPISIYYLNTDTGTTELKGTTDFDEVIGFSI